MNEEKMFNISRPHKNLLKYYIISSVLTGPLMLFSLPVLIFRYFSLKYRFDEEGVTVSWGVFFKKETHLTYARIQDIHLLSGIIQRWLGLADIQIQTASGNASAEIIIEGLLEFEEVRNFLYNRMRGYHESLDNKEDSGDTASGGNADEVLRDILEELKASRAAVEKLVPAGDAGEKA
jgi:putative membrane protein